ncbi:hypothetical protein HQ487_01560 [Candidatus Uhrbacteria bacterium]|nr:hypothetical protein [Candidatus Uhrbacteria bacterium]
MRYILYIVLMVILGVLPGQVWAFGTLSNVGSDHYKVDFNLTLIGPGVGPGHAEVWKRWLDSVWDTAGMANECPKINFEFHVDSSDAFDEFDLPGDYTDDTRTRIHSDALSGLQESFPDSSYVYVVDSDPGQYYRGWANSAEGSFGQSGWSTMDAGSSARTISHEVGHLMGMDDHYSENAEGLTTVDEGWEGNLAADGRINDSDLVNDSSKFIDARVLSEIIEAIEHQTGEDLACGKPDIEGEMVWHHDTGIVATDVDGDLLVELDYIESEGDGSDFLVTGSVNPIDSTLTCTSSICNSCGCTTCTIDKATTGYVSGIANWSEDGNTLITTLNWLESQWPQETVSMFFSCGGSATQDTALLSSTFIQSGIIGTSWEVEFPDDVAQKEFSSKNYAGTGIGVMNFHTNE